MKKFFYSSIVTLLLNLAVGYLCYPAALRHIQLEKLGI